MEYYSAIKRNKLLITCNNMNNNMNNSKLLYELKAKQKGIYAR